jgi:glycosyltransferase involved in cell wall biosynthesis
MNKKVNEEYKIIVGHPGRQHSFRLASALKKNKMLFKYVTTVYDKENSLLMKIIKKIVTKENKDRAKNRKNKDLLEEDVIQFGEIRGLIEIFLARYDKSKKIYSWWQRKTADFFGEKVARLAIKNNVDAVIMYDTNAKKCFEILEKKAPNIIRIMDVSAANRLYMKQIYQKDMKKFPEFANRLKQERHFLWNLEECKRLKEEIERTQFFLVPSKFVKKSLLFSNVKEDQIMICPYGTNFKPEERLYKKNEKDKINAIYVGNITALKGIHYLLEAALKIPEEKFQLTVVGNYNNENKIFSKYMSKINFLGRVPHEKVKELLKQSDIFIFPSLGEGLSLAVLEAMSCGLPCIVTRNSGANDAIIEGINGFEVEIQDINVLKEKIEWFIENKKFIPKMGKAAIEKVQEYTWENYEYRVSNLLRKRLGERNEL